MKIAVHRIIWGALLCASLSLPAHAAENPCQDAQYQALKSKNVNDMSEREFEMYKSMDASCNQYRSQSSVMDEGITRSMNMRLIYGVIGVLVLLAL